MEHAQRLILAVESLNPTRVQLAIEAQLADLAAQRQALPPEKRVDFLKTYINDRHLLAPGVDPTALHVACIRYASASTPAAKATLNQIVKILLDNGAGPFLEMGQIKRQSNYGPLVLTSRGRTAIELCNGAFPESLSTFLSDLADRESAFSSAHHIAKHKTSQELEAERIGKWREKQAARAERGEVVKVNFSGKRKAA